MAAKIAPSLPIRIGPAPPISFVVRAPFASLALCAVIAATSVVVLLYALLGVAEAAPFDPDGSDWEGCAEFLRLAREQAGAARISVVTRLDMRQLKREDAIILIHPERTLDADALAAFMRHGGRVVLLDDFGTGAALLAHFGIERVPAPTHPAESLRNNPQFAIAEPASNHRLVQDVARVVTNHPTGVRHPQLSPVLKMRAVGEPDVLLAEAGAVGEGRFLAVGDASIVINAMLRYPGNRAFARAILRYAGDEDGASADAGSGSIASASAAAASPTPRGGQIYIATGAFESTGHFGGASAFADPIDETLRAAQDALDDVRRDGIPNTASYVVAVLLGLALVVWVGSRAGKTHRALTPRFARGIPLVVQGGVAGHAAVIGAPSTSRVLAMLELKSALEEDLAALLHVDPNAGRDLLVAKVTQGALLDEQGVRVLQKLLLRLANVETLALSRRANSPERIRDREVIATAAAIKDILSAVRRRAHDTQPWAKSPDASDT